MKNKKSFVITDTLIYIIIAVFVFLILMFIVPRLLGGAASETKNLLSSTRDYDNDGFSDFFDKCVCVYGDIDGCSEETERKTSEELKNLKYKGCPNNKKPTYDNKE